MAIRILHVVSGSLQGGAAKGALNLCQSQSASGYELAILHSFGPKPPTISGLKTITLANNIFFRTSRLLATLLDRLLFYFAGGRVDPHSFHSGLVGLSLGFFFMRKNSVFQKADIIHFHEIHSFIPVFMLRLLNKPIVITLRDMWFFTGGCHYSLGCDHYSSSCGRCPVLSSHYKLDLSFINYLVKKHSLPRQISIVGISSWIVNEALRSPILSKVPVATIHNSVDTSYFKPLTGDSTSTPITNKTILFGCINLVDNYKGIRLLMKALELVNLTDITLKCFGQGFDYFSGSPIYSHIHWLGLINDQSELRRLYASSYIFISPSIQEAFGKTAAESLSCGTPVLCFSNTGTSDLVHHKKTGYLASHNSITSLMDGITWLTSLAPSDYHTMRSDCRTDCVERFDGTLANQQYKAIYNQLLTSK